ncbi:hypothetical protein RI844_04380 [Thalassotalea fonticola]|uniref:Uncharacterized protein n=1 Tax=Thalassotalea fonticola TaxID=3065649 RepID=A0ABZ0GSY2_9GAMM|nr:hypothetical protein RI844_04380 [Colwelliaceae bacterium S1-1]
MISIGSRLLIDKMINNALTQTPQINSSVYPEQPYNSLAMFQQCEADPWSFYDPTSPTYFEGLKTPKWQLP